MALYLLRHGALPPNPQRRFVGQRDLPLSPRGQRQIAFWAKELAVTPLKAIFCSSLQRCRESARKIARDLGWSVVDCAAGDAPRSVEDIRREVLSRVEPLLG